MRVISFFSGAGGMDLGLIFAGHTMVWGNDFDEYAVQSYNHNIGSIDNMNITHGDISMIMSKDSNEIDQILPDADIIVGGFPCQGFSIANNNRSMEDERNYLYLDLLRAISIKQPRFFVLENVKGLESMEKGAILTMILDELENAGVDSGGQGYTVIYNVLNAKDYGVPQNRERVIILGIRNDLLDGEFDINSVRLDIPSKGKDPRKLLNVPKTHSKESEIDDPISPIEKVNIMYQNFIDGNIHLNQELFNTNEIYRINTLRDVIADLPPEYVENDVIEGLTHHYGTKCVVKISNRVGNRATEWDKVSPTIMGRGSGTGGPLIIPHPNTLRRMSIREVARIQTFPDQFYFMGNNSACYRQIGNAVPILMAYHIGKILPV